MDACFKVSDDRTIRESGPNTIKYEFLNNFGHGKW